MKFSEACAIAINQAREIGCAFYVHESPSMWDVTAGTEWKDITKIDAWSGKYSIDTSNTSNRGSLTIKRNLSSNDKQQLQFEADLYDYRTNSILHITADPYLPYTE